MAINTQIISACIIGWLACGQLPDNWALIGIAIIIASGGSKCADNSTPPETAHYFRWTVRLALPAHTDKQHQAQAARP